MFSTELLLIDENLTALSDDPAVEDAEVLDISVNAGGVVNDGRVDGVVSNDIDDALGNILKDSCEVELVAAIGVVNGVSGNLNIESVFGSLLFVDI